ncbi:MAG: hypothetical protein ACRYGK_04330 [Janthinobacterium lividum]
MTESPPLYLLQQQKKNPAENDLPVYAKAMRSKEGVFEGVSFIRSRDKASLMTMAEAQQAAAWARKKKPLANLYKTTIVAVTDLPAA